MTPSIVLVIVTVVVISTLTIAKPNPLDRPQIVTITLNLMALALVGGFVWTFLTNPWYIGVATLVGAIIITASVGKITDGEGKMRQTILDGADKSERPNG